ncbi:uncharacterized protein KY384_002841 [Bacidia gigantensis]|uniref:uncharacterized protein n=1 Tax=Bacidia gigantensis TaxID=2732470 RepID=UPI001D051BF0|nr:uncharacterized protein KY384_002841 [Bacidia gigantensis]KAG8532356.1 hypothetical protein KY384_002841 [Bacidia gigantensis]
MPGELHQSLVGACHEFAANIKRRVLEKGWKLPSGSEVKLVKGGGQMTVWSNDNKYSRDPDMSMKVVDGTQIKPFFIFEVAVSQTEDDLMKKAHHYLNGSHGDITLICLIIAKSDPVVDRKLDLQDVSVRIFIARIGRSSPTASGTWKPELFVMYDATKRVDADKANRPTFSGHITISKQDIWAKRGVVLPPGDSIDIPLDLFSSEIEDAVQSHLDDQYVLAATSPASNQSDLTTESSEGSSAGKSSASGGDDKGKDSDYEQSSPPSEESDD